MARLKSFRTSREASGIYAQRLPALQFSYEPILSL
jgi:hypothetical protein